MKLSSNAIISSRKLKDYLLKYRERNDKSIWLAQAGYEKSHWKVLENDLRKQILSLDAKLIDKNAYGYKYEIKGILTGSNKKKISVSTIWMKEHETEITKFITMIPSKKFNDEI